MSIYKSAAGKAVVEARYRELLADWPVPSEQCTIATCEGPTFVLVCGPVDAAPVVLFQGSGANAAMWMSEIVVWAQNHRVYAVDLIGEPGLSAPVRPPLSSDAYARWLDDVMDGLSLSRAVLVGISLGGWLALDYAIRRPERVDRVALLCPSGVGRQRRGFLLKVLPLLLLGWWGRRKAMSLVAGPPPSDPTPAQVAIGRFSALIFAHFRPRRGRVPLFTDDALRGLGMPVMLIVGGRDPLLDSAESRRRIETLVSNATVRLLPDAGHILREQSSAIIEFLAKENALAASGVGGSSIRSE